MILNPAIIALLAGALLVSGFSVYASAAGLKIIRRWDLKSGSATQLEMERKTYLISTILSYVLGFEIFSLFLFVYTADHIHPLFIGAMCAAGSLNANDYGYPALTLKTVNVVLCGAWLVVNGVDNRSPDYPLIRFKYKFLICISALLLLETVFLSNYFGDLRSNVITSCCGTLFSEDAESVAGGLASAPPLYTMAAFFVSAALVFRFGFHFLATGKGDKAFSVASTCFFVLALASVVSFISVYYYELPTHHCPFDLLQKEYNYIGYPMYASLFAAGATGLGMGIVGAFEKTPSIDAVTPGIQRKICIFAMASYAVFVAISAYPVIFSDFKLLNY